MTDNVYSSWPASRINHTTCRCHIRLQQTLIGRSFGACGAVSAPRDGPRRRALVQIEDLLQRIRGGSLPRGSTRSPHIDHFSGAPSYMIRFTADMLAIGNVIEATSRSQSHRPSIWISPVVRRQALIGYLHQPPVMCLPAPAPRKQRGRLAVGMPSFTALPPTAIQQ